MQLTSTKPPAIEPCTRNVYELVRPPAPPAVCVAAPSILRLSGLRARPSLNERFARTTEQRAGQPVYASKRAVLSFDPAERAWQIWQLRSGKRELCAVCATGRSVTPFELATKNRSRWRALHAKTKTWADEPTVSLEAVPAFHVSGSILRPELMGYYELVEGQTCAASPCGAAIRAFSLGARRAPHPAARVVYPSTVPRLSNRKSWLRFDEAADRQNGRRRCLPGLAVDR